MGLHHSPRIVREGLVLCLDSINTRSYPGTGNIWYDLSGNSNNASATTISTVADTSGSVISLNASSQIDVSLSQVVNKFAFTLSYWGRPTATPDSNYQPIIRLKNSADANNYFISDTREVATPYILHYVKDFSASNWDSITMINTAEYNNFRWHHYTLAMHAESDWRSYLDGKLIGVNTTPTQDLTGYGNINQVIMGGSSCNFNISNVTLYYRPLSAQEVQQNFNALRGRYSV